MTEMTYQERQRAALVRWVESLEHCAETAREEGEHMGAAESERLRLESAHPEYAEPSPRRDFATTMVMIAIPAFWMLDILLLGSFAREIASRSGLGPTWERTAKFLAPGLLILVDLWLSHRLALAKLDMEREPFLTKRRNHLVVNGWRTLAVLLLAAYVGMVATAQWVGIAAKRSDPTLPTSWIDWTIIAALATLTLIFHAMLIFSGDEPKVYALYRWRRWGAARRQRLAARRAEAAAEAAVGEFNRLSIAVADYNATTERAPFRVAYTRTARELLRSRLGYDAIAPAPSTPATPPRHPDDGGDDTPPINDGEVRL